MNSIHQPQIVFFHQKKIFVQFYGQQCGGLSLGVKSKLTPAFPDKPEPGTLGRLHALSPGKHEAY